MAAARKKAKPPTDEFPVLRMLIENTRLVPAYPADAERLASYVNGTKCVVWLSVEAGHERPLIRQWWAVLGWYGKNCDLPWGKDKDAGSNAIKYALRMFTPVPVDAAKTRWIPNYNSLNDFDDVELREFLEGMKAILYQLTGVDQETYRKESGHGFDDIPFIQSSDDLPALSDDGAGSVADSSPAAGGTEPAALIEHHSPDDDSPPRPGEEPASAAQPLAGAGGDQSSDDDQSQSGDASDDEDGPTSAEAASDGAQTGAVATHNLTDAEVTWLRNAASRIVLRSDVQAGGFKGDALAEMRALFRDVLKEMPPAASREAKSRMTDIQTLTLTAARGEGELHVDFIASIALTTVTALALAAEQRGKQ